jgi:GT2 family glycosyltransferase
MTSRELYDLVGGFPQDKRRTFFLEDAAYIERIEKIGFRAAVLRDLRVTHAGGPYYAPSTAEKEAYWAEVERREARRTAVKRVLLALPFARRLNRRFRWFQEPAG